MARFDWFLIAFALLALGLIGWAVVDSNHRADRKCNAIMSLASTKRDSLDAAIACAAISDAAANRLTTAVAAGAVAGAVAGSSR